MITEQPSYTPSPLLNDEANGTRHQMTIGRSNQRGRSLSSAPGSKISIPSTMPPVVEDVFVESGSPGGLKASLGRNSHAVIVATITARRGGSVAKSSRTTGIH